MARKRPITSLRNPDGTLVRCILCKDKISLMEPENPPVQTWHYRSVTSNYSNGNAHYYHLKCGDRPLRKSVASKVINT